MSDDEESNRIDLEEPGPSSKKAKQKVSLIGENQYSFRN